MLTGRWCGGTPVMSWPSIRMRPASGVSRPASRRSKVVLPHPEPPSRANSSPRSMARSTLSTAVTAPKRLVTPSMRTIGVSPLAAFIVACAALLDTRQETSRLRRPVDGANDTDNVLYWDIAKVFEAAVQAITTIVSENEEGAGRHVEFNGVLRSALWSFEDHVRPLGNVSR